MFLSRVLSPPFLIKLALECGRKYSACSPSGEVFQGLDLWALGLVLTTSTRSVGRLCDELQSCAARSVHKKFVPSCLVLTSEPTSVSVSALQPPQHFQPHWGISKLLVAFSALSWSVWSPVKTALWPVSWGKPPHTSFIFPLLLCHGRHSTLS